jgi:beta-glucosidase
MYRGRMSSLSFEGDRLSEARAVCAEADVIIVCTGLDGTLEGEQGDTGNDYGSGDKPYLNLPGLQDELVKIAHGTGKPVILANITGSAMTLNYADENAAAIFQCFYPGAMGGKAFAQLLFGDFSPGGKLPVTFCKTMEELPEFTDYSMAGRTYRYMTGEALYPFGYGLTYGDYEILGLKMSGNTVEGAIKNIGGTAITETLQVYVRYESPEGLHLPKWSLKYFTKVALAPGEEKPISITLPEEAFALADENGSFVVNNGEYKLFVGCSQPDARSIALTGKKPEVLICQK